MSRLRYDLRCKKCGAVPIRVKNVNKMGRGWSGTYYLCTTNCGRIDVKDVEEIKDGNENLSKDSNTLEAGHLKSVRRSGGNKNV